MVEFCNVFTLNSVQDRKYSSQFITLEIYHSKRHITNNGHMMCLIAFTLILDEEHLINEDSFFTPAEINSVHTIKSIIHINAFPNSYA